jgi:hypothetical protein
MSHRRIIRVSKAEAKRRGLKVLTTACQLGCYFCTDCPDEPCCHGTVCKAPEAQRVKQVAEKVDKLVTSGKARIKVGPGGKIIFAGLPDMALHDQDPEAVLAALKVHGSAKVRLAIRQAEMLAGRGRTTTGRAVIKR